MTKFLTKPLKKKTFSFDLQLDRMWSIMGQRSEAWQQGVMLLFFKHELNVSQAESRLRTQRVMVDAGFPHAGPSVVERWGFVA